VAWLGSRLASHGFVVVTMKTNSSLDFPASRVTQLMAALNHVINNSNATVKSRIDPNRRAVGGHSMGGGADGDTMAPVALHARPFYAGLPAATLKAYGELNGATHSTPTSTNAPMGRYAVSWMKRFVDADTRYSPFLCGAEHTRYATAAAFDRYQQNCPY
jgi:predicted dienelactone hydrolase